VLLGHGLLAALVGLIGLSLFIFYSTPNGEQWREAMAYVDEQRQPADYVVTTPGYYMRPIAYYLEGALPARDTELAHAPFALDEQGVFVAADYGDDQLGLTDVDVATAPAQRLWLVTGYGTEKADELAWFYDDYTVVAERHFLGVEVLLGDRIEAPSGQVAVPLYLGGRAAGSLRQVGGAQGVP
jgi:hypothetical protein